MVNAIATLTPRLFQGQHGDTPTPETPVVRKAPAGTKEFAHVGKNGPGEIVRNRCRRCAAGWRCDPRRRAAGGDGRLQVHQIGEGAARQIRQGKARRQAQGAEEGEAEEARDRTRGRLRPCRRHGRRRLSDGAWAGRCRCPGCLWCARWLCQRRLRRWKLCQWLRDHGDADHVGGTGGVPGRWRLLGRRWR